MKGRKEMPMKNNQQNDHSIYVKFTFVRVVILVLVMSVAPTIALIWLTENDWQNNVVNLVHRNDVQQRNAAVENCQEDNDLKRESNKRVDEIQNVVEVLDSFLTNAIQARTEEGDLEIAKSYIADRHKLRNVGLHTVGIVKCRKVFPKPSNDIGFEIPKDLVPIATLNK